MSDKTHAVGLRRGFCLCHNTHIADKAHTYTARRSVNSKLEGNVASKTHYEILEVAQDASQEEIRQNYRRLILLHHPDKQTLSQVNSALDKQAEALNVAYAVLSDAALRAEYDRSLQEKLGASGPLRSRVGGIDADI